MKTLFCQSVFLLGFILPPLNLSPKTDTFPWNKYDLVSEEKIIFEETHRKVRELLQDTSRTQRSNRSNQGKGNQNQLGNSTNNSGNTSGSNSSGRTGDQGNQNNQGNTNNNSGNSSGSGSSNQTGNQVTAGGSGTTSTNSSTEAYVKSIIWEGVLSKSETKETASDSGRNLTSSEYNLRLVIDCKQNTYRLLGKIEIEGIQIQGKDEMDIKAKPINAKIDEGAEGTSGIDEEIDVAGSFSPAVNDGIPAEIRGSKDLLKDLPEEFKEFMKDLGGDQNNLLSWNIRRKPIALKKNNLDFF